MSYQLKFNTTFDGYLKDLPCWKTISDIPENILTLIKSKSQQLQVFETTTNKFYCSICMHELHNGHCDMCNKNYPKINIQENIYNNPLISTIHTIKNNNYYQLNNNLKYFIFDIKDDIIYLYYLEEKITYNTSIIDFPRKVSELIIKDVFIVDIDKIQSLNDSIPVSYETLINLLNKMHECELWEQIDKEYQKYSKYLDIEGFVFRDNLNILKNTIYKYTNIWDTKVQEYRTIKSLTLIPLHIKGYEYLIKNKLYELSYTAYMLDDKTKNFKERFGVDKKFLKFMQKHDITYYELQALKTYQEEDIEMLRFISDNNYLFDELYNNFNISSKNIINYFKNKNIPLHNINEYYDYIYLLKEMGFDLQDKKWLYPNDFLKEHNKLLVQFELKQNPKINENLKYIADISSINNYEDDNYIIYPAHSIEDLIEESKQQHNCVKTYAQNIVNGDCQIYFMRKKTSPNTSLVTIEVRNKKIVQARTKFNELPDKDLKAILNFWEKSLFPIEIK